MTFALRVSGASKSYGSRAVLREVSLDLPQGQLLTLLGPNGAGKTTLIRSICGRVRLDRGEIELLGRKLSPSGDRSPLGFVPQDFAIYPDLTARQNLEVFGRFHGVTRRRLRYEVDEALAWSLLIDRADDLAGDFSGGMKRRLNIACGVLHHPAVVLLDEPTVGVDPQSRERIFEMLDELRARGTAIILTTHQLDEVERRCDQIVVIDSGRIVAAGTLDQLIDATVGRDQELVVTLDRHPLRVPAHFTLEADGVTLTRRLSQGVRDLSLAIAEVQLLGCRVEQLSVKTPTLQAVFLKLTGKELRE
jgi:ABC-2 type transport system ATP-binding protein